MGSDTPSVDTFSDLDAREKVKEDEEDEEELEDDEEDEVLADVCGSV